MFRIENLIMTSGRLSAKKVISWLVAIVLALVVSVNAMDLAERNSSGIYQMNQSYWGGKMNTRFEPGFYFQLMSLFYLLLDRLMRLNRLLLAVHKQSAFR